MVARNALLQPNFPSWEGSVPAAGEEQHSQVVDLEPGQRAQHARTRGRSSKKALALCFSGQLTVVSWLDPTKSFSATYTWQAAAEPCGRAAKPNGAYPLWPHSMPRLRMQDPSWDDSAKISALKPARIQT